MHWRTDGIAAVIFSLFSHFFLIPMEQLLLEFILISLRGVAGELLTNA